MLTLRYHSQQQQQYKDSHDRIAAYLRVSIPEQTLSKRPTASLWRAAFLLPKDTDTPAAFAVWLKRTVRTACHRTGPS